MGRTAGAKAMTPAEDVIAKLLTEAETPMAEMSRILGRDPKAIKAGVARASERKIKLTRSQRKTAEHLSGFYQWLREGRRAGYVEMLIGACDE